MDGTPSANFDTFPAAIMTVFQVGAGLPGDSNKGSWGHLLTPPWLGGALYTKQAAASSLSCTTKWTERDGSTSTSVTGDEEFQNSSGEALSPHQCAVGSSSGTAAADWVFHRAGCPYTAPVCWWH